MIPFAANALQCIVNGEETPKIVPSLWHFVTLPEKDRATAIGNMHKEFGKDRAYGFGDMLAYRQTDRQIDVLITILRHRSRGRSNDHLAAWVTNENITLIS